MILLIAVVSYSRLFLWAEQTRIPHSFLRAEVEKVGTHLRQHTCNGDVIISSSCGVRLVHWHGRCRAIEMPINPEDVRKIVYELMPVDAVLMCEDHNPNLLEQINELLPDFALVDSFDHETSAWYCHYKLYVRKPSISASAILQPSH